MDASEGQSPEGLLTPLEERSQMESCDFGPALGSVVGMRWKMWGRWVWLGKNGSVVNILPSELPVRHPRPGVSRCWRPAVPAGHLHWGAVSE